MAEALSEEELVIPTDPAELLRGIARMSAAMGVDVLGRPVSGGPLGAVPGRAAGSASDSGGGGPLEVSAVGPGEPPGPRARG